MTTTSKVLTGLLLSATLASGLYASCDMKQDKSKSGKMMYKNPILAITKHLDLNDTQKEQIKTIIIESKKQQHSISEAFSDSSFDKEKFITIMNEKRENMLKSKADTVEKIYAILDNKQKEHFKTLLEQKMNKMHHKGMGFDKNSNGRG